MSSSDSDGEPQADDSDDEEEEVAQEEPPQDDPPQANAVAQGNCQTCLEFEDMLDKAESEKNTALAEVVEIQTESNDLRRQNMDLKVTNEIMRKRFNKAAESNAKAKTKIANLTARIREQG